MIRSFRSPQKYLQGPGVFRSALAEVRRLGTKGLLVTDGFVYQLVGKELERALQDLGMEIQVLLVEEVVSLEDLVSKGTCEVVIALGGGRAIDIGKTLAARGGWRCAVLPTSAATDAPTSSISVTYDSNGTFLGYEHYPFNPDLVLVDSQVIFHAPGKFLAQGIADGLCTYVEATTVWEQKEQGLNNERPTIAALALAKACRDTLLADGQQALADQAKGVHSQAFENVVEANILLSGLGFENGGLSLAHAFHNTLLGDRSLSVSRSHGEIVGVGLLLQLLVEESEEFSTYREFLAEIKLPLTLEALGVTLTPTQAESLAQGILAAATKGNPLKAGITKADLLAGLATLA